MEYQLGSRVAPRSSRSAYFTAHHLFGVLPQPELIALVAEVGERRYPKGHHPFFAGDVAARVFVVKSGLISLTRTDRRGNERALVTFQTGDVLGARAAVLGLPYANTATALTDAELFVIRADTFTRLHHCYREVALETLRELHRVANDAQQTIYDRSAEPLTSRLAAFVLKSAAEGAVPGANALESQPVLSHQDLALLMGTTRVSVTRVLGRFCRARLIAVTGRRVLILKPDALRRLAEE